MEEIHQGPRLKCRERDSPLSSSQNVPRESGIPGCRILVALRKPRNSLGPAEM